MNDKIQFYCSLCDKEFSHQNIFSQDLHIRGIHGAKIIADAVKQYTRVIFVDMK